MNLFLDVSQKIRKKRQFGRLAVGDVAVSGGGIKIMMSHQSELQVVSSGREVSHPSSRCAITVPYLSLTEKSGLSPSLVSSLPLSKVLTERRELSTHWVL